MVRPLPIAALFFALATHAAEHEHGARRGVQSLDVYADRERIHLLTGESRDGSNQPQLFHVHSENGGATWSPPVRVGEGMAPGFSLHRGMDAQLAASGDSLIAAWMTAGTDPWGSGPIATALSSDGGKTWRAGPNPADDGTTTGHGFIDIGADEAGAFHLTWLDSRDGRQGLRYARSSDRGKTWSPNTTVQAATCECCANTFAIGAGGHLAILFRDGSPRDMRVALSRDGGREWIGASHAGAFDWQFNGCPHVGGGLAFGGEVLHAAIWTGLPERAGVHYTSSRDLGAMWSQPRGLGGPTASHPDLAAASRGRVAAVWDERADGRGIIWGAASADGGANWAPAVQLSLAVANASHPRVTFTGTGFRAFWTEDAADRPTVWASAPLP